MSVFLFQGVFTFSLVHAETGDADIIRRLPFQINDVVYDPQRNVLYVSQPSSIGVGGNSITAIDPITAEALWSVYVGSEPTQMVISDDGQTMYVVLSGAFAIRRVDLVTHTAGIQFSLGNQNSTQPRTAIDIAIAPGNPNLLAVTHERISSDPPINGAAIFDNGVRLPLTGPSNDSGAFYLTFSGSASTLYGGSPFSGLRTMTVSGDGITDLGTSTSFGVSKLRFDQGRVYTSAGQVIDPLTRSLLGTFSTSTTKAFVSDSNVERAYYATRNLADGSVTVKAFNVNTYALAGSTVIPSVGADPTTLVRYATNGLAMRSGNSRLILIQTALIPTNDPLPIPSVTPTLTPTPSPTPFAAFRRILAMQANDLFYHPPSERLLVSIASTDANYGNSITTIDPTPGAVENSVFIGSEPGEMALAGDDTTLYVALDGVGAVRKYDVLSQTPGSQFSVGIIPGAIKTVDDLAVKPGDPNMVAVGYFSNGGLKLFSNGSPRGQVASGFGNVNFRTTDQLLYGNNPVKSYSVSGIGALGFQGNIITFSAGNSVYAPNGLIYTGNGRVVDSASGIVRGTFTGVGFRSHVVVDVGLNRAFFLTESDSASGYSIRAYALDTFLPIGYVQVGTNSGQSPVMVRWGANGLAYRSRVDSITLIQSTLVDPNEPPPSPTPTPSMTPTATPTPIPPTFTRRLNLPANDVVYSSATHKLYASVPSYDGSGAANSITTVDPVTGDIEASVYVGSEPGMLAISDDGQTIYVKLNGEGVGTVRRFDIASQTPGITFEGPAFFVDMKIRPGNPQTVAFAAGGGGGVSIYDNGVARPQVGGDHITHLAFADADVVYGYNSAGQEELFRFTVNPNGVGGVELGDHLITGDFNLEYFDGLLYSGGGRVVNTQTLQVAGTFNYGGWMAVDPQLGRAFFLYENAIRSYSTSTFLSTGISSLASLYQPSDLVRWGQNGLAFRTAESSTNAHDSHLYIVQSSIVDPTVQVPTGHQMAASTYSVSESISTLTVIVNRMGDISGTSAVRYATSDITAQAGLDYVPLDGVLNFAPGDTSGSVVIQIRADNIYEQNEFFRFSLSEPTASGTAYVVYPGSSVITIRDNNSRPLISGINTVVSEQRAGQTSTALVNVNLTHPSTQQITVNYATANGSATSGSDYVPANGTLTFGPLETAKTIPVTILGDNLLEGNETFSVTLTNPVNGYVANGTSQVVIIDFVLTSAQFDYDGDNRSDISVFRPSSGAWYLQRSTAGYFGVGFGSAEDRIVPADYDGDGKTDIAVYRPSTGIWYVTNSANGTVTYNVFGIAEDLPTPADYDGDGKADISVFRPSTGTWYRQNSSNGAFVAAQFGANGDKPTIGDFDGDGKADIAVFRPSTGAWYQTYSSNGFLFGEQFGISTDKITPADYDGDGKTDIAIYRPSEGLWYVKNSATTTYTPFVFGLAEDIPVPGDYDGGGKADIGVFRPSDGTWYIVNSTNGSFTIFQFGQNGDRPTESAFNN